VLTSKRDRSDIKQDNPALSSTLSITNIDKSEEADIIICIARASSKHSYPQEVSRNSLIPLVYAPTEYPDQIHSTIIFRSKLTRKPRYRYFSPMVNARIYYLRPKE
jgi:hypothetical protein